MRNVKRVLSGFMCICMLILTTVPVEAADQSTCLHPSITVHTTNVAGNSLSSSRHEVVKKTTHICDVCGFVRVYREVIGDELHSVVYDDLGHTGVQHKYRRRCTGCGFSHVIEIPCNYSDGSHQKP